MTKLFMVVLSSFLFSIGLCLAPTSAMADLGATGIQMGTLQCPDEVDIDCDNPSYESSKIVDASNSCISLFGISDNIMSNFNMSGEFENCVTPTSAVKDPSGVNTWAICCVKRDSGNACKLFCTRYIDQKK